MSFLKPPAPTIPTPIQPEAPPPVMGVQGSKPGKKNPQATFLGAGDIANAPMSSGGGMQKTLLGQ